MALNVKHRLNRITFIVGNEIELFGGFIQQFRHVWDSLFWPPAFFPKPKKLPWNNTNSTYNLASFFLAFIGIKPPLYLIQTTHLNVLFPCSKFLLGRAEKTMNYAKPFHSVSRLISLSLLWFPSLLFGIKFGSLQPFSCFWLWNFLFYKVV